MWDKVREQVQTELDQLHQQFEVYDELLSKAGQGQPNPVELSALAAFLHSFYNGVENIFKRIAIEIDNSRPVGEFWHQRLLSMVTEKTPDRMPVISAALAFRLKEYLQFRHFFRHAYTFQLDWERMKSLVQGSGQTLRLLEEELAIFLRTGGAGN